MQHGDLEHRSLSKNKINRNGDHCKFFFDLFCQSWLFTWGKFEFCEKNSVGQRIHQRFIYYYDYQSLQSYKKKNTYTTLFAAQHVETKRMENLHEPKKRSKVIEQQNKVELESVN